MALVFYRQSDQLCLLVAPGAGLGLTQLVLLPAPHKADNSRDSVVHDAGSPALPSQQGRMPESLLQKSGTVLAIVGLNVRR
jgi:hypothetical protein